MPAPGAETPAGGAAPPGEVLEVVVAARPAMAAALGPLLAVFARIAGLGGSRARALADEVVGLVSAACRRAGPVRVRLNRRARRLRVLVSFPGASTALPARGRPPRALPGLRVERPGRGSLVLTVPDPAEDARA